MRKPLPFAAGILATILIAGAAGVAIGASSRAGPSVTNLALLNGVIQLVQRDYVHPVGPDELTKDALKGMLSRLDPHSDYMDELEFKELQSDLSGRFGGLGIQISAQDGVPKVISPIDDTPASRAGLAGGDLIVAIDGRSTHGVDLQKIVRILRGNPGTPVKLTVSRGAQPAVRGDPDAGDHRGTVDQVADAGEQRRLRAHHRVRQRHRARFPQGARQAQEGRRRQAARPRARPAQRSGRLAQRGGRDLRQLPRRRHRGEHPRPPEEARTAPSRRRPRATFSPACRWWC